MFIRAVKYLANLFRQRMLVALLLLPASAYASGNEDWTIAVSPYLWVTGQKGDVATLPPAPPADLDISFNDVIDHLDMSVMGFVEARKGRFGLFGEMLYVGVSADIDTPGDSFSGADYEQDLWSIGLGGSYALTQDKDHHLDVTAGVRYWDVDNKLKLKAGRLPETKTSEQENWFDPFVGLKGRVRLYKHWYLSGWGLVAVAGDSDSYWDVFGGAGYEYNELVSFVAGYRHQSVDYEDGAFLFDVELSGPMIGLTIQF